MSLLLDAMENCTFLTRTRVADGYGSATDVMWTRGASFRAAIVFDTSVEARTAEKLGVTSLYTVTTEKSLVLEYHEVFQRERDGKIFRVTSDGDDKYTPLIASLDMRQVTAEEYEITGGING